MKRRVVLLIVFLLGILLLESLVYQLIIARVLPAGNSCEETKASVPEYGKPLSWEEVKVLFPRYGTAVLIDLETGKTFEVQRRGGTYHADIQPVAKRDTQVLKELYPYGWSWKRRAVVACLGLERVAASINGMPHGSGKIKGNDFSGHFCIHFRDSKVHLSGKVDLAHQMMVWKAAGQPLAPFLKAGPKEVLELVFTALNQDDPGLAALGIYPGFGEDIWLVIESINRRLPQIQLHSLKTLESDRDDQLTCQVRLKLNYPGKKGIIERTGDLAIRQHPSGGRWLVSGDDLKKLLACPLTDS